MKRTIAGALGALLASTALLAGCSSGTDASADPSTTTAPASGGVVDLTFWAWDPGMDVLVKAWNDANPDIQVKLENPEGGDALVAQMITAHQAGNGPDVGKIEYQALPSLISSGVVVPIDEYIGDVQDAYAENVWNLTRFDGKTYGLAQDFAPLMFFYRADIFEELGLTVPTTWAEYEATAGALHAADPTKYLGTFSSNDPGWFAGLTQQAGADWWSYSDAGWSVAIDAEPSRKVADFWQSMIDAGTIKSDPFWTPQWNKEMNDGTYAGWVSGAWAAAQIPGIAPDGADKWRVAPLPVWDEDVTGIWGGAAMSVMADSEHPAEAAKFITWLNTSPEALSLQITNIGVYPAAEAGRTLPELSTPPEYFSGQSDYFEVIGTSAEVARAFDVWGPNANVTFNAYSDGTATALTNKTPLAGVLPTMQSKSVDGLKSLGFTVAD